MKRRNFLKGALSIASLSFVGQAISNDAKFTASYNEFDSYWFYRITYWVDGCEWHTLVRKLGEDPATEEELFGTIEKDFDAALKHMRFHAEDLNPHILAGINQSPRSRGASQLIMNRCDEL